jgi:MFS family permease
MLNSKAKKMRKESPACTVFGPTEEDKLNWRSLGSWKKLFRDALPIMGRPYKMLATEPIVLFLSLLSGFADALIFSFLESYGYVFGPGGWNFTPSQLGFALSALFIGYWLAGLSYVPVIRRDNQKRKAGKVLGPETRLKALLWIAPLLAIGLFGSAFTVAGPPLPWIAPLIFAILIGWANMAIYFATIDYMVAAYGGKYSASATGGNGFSRDVLAGICSFYTGPMYHKLGNQNATWLLFGLSVLVIIPVFWIYKKGPWLRARSKYAAEVEIERQRNEEIKSGQQHGQPDLIQQETNASAPVQAQPYSAV